MLKSLSRRRGRLSCAISATLAASVTLVGAPVFAEDVSARIPAPLPERATRAGLDLYRSRPRRPLRMDRSGSERFYFPDVRLRLSVLAFGPAGRLRRRRNRSHRTEREKFPFRTRRLHLYGEDRLRVRGAAHALERGGRNPAFVFEYGSDQARFGESTVLERAFARGSLRALKL
jgi:hypothetical protein